jgi:hypothetical protein
VIPNFSEVLKNRLNSKEILSAISVSENSKNCEHLVEMVQYYCERRGMSLRSIASELFAGDVGKFAIYLGFSWLAYTSPTSWSPPAAAYISARLCSRRYGFISFYGHW